MRGLTLALVLAAMALAGCANEYGLRVQTAGINEANIEFAAGNGWRLDEICETLRYHLIEITSFGKYRATDTNLLCDGGGRFRQPETFAQHLANIEARVASQSPDTDIVFIVHGGLVSRATGLREALVVARAIRADNNRNARDQYPIFLNWRSGGIDAYREQTFAIRKGERNEAVAIPTSPVEIASDIGRGIADMPGLGALEATRLLDTFGKAFDECSTDAASPAKTICPESMQGNKTPALRTAQYIGLTPVRVLTSPFVNGMGRTAWENMVRRTRNPFWRETSKGELKPGIVKELFDDLCRADSPLASRRLTLIGHSMGSMILSDVLRAYPECRYRNIVFMGAALSIRDFDRTVIPVLSNGRDSHFYNLSLLPTAEAREMSFGGTIPSGSLLEWIDEMYTPPTTRFDRTFGKWVNVRGVLKTLSSNALEKMTLRVFGTDEGQPKEHGDFNNADMCFWREEFWTAPWREHRESCNDLLCASGLAQCG